MAFIALLLSSTIITSAAATTVANTTTTTTTPAREFNECSGDPDSCWDGDVYTSKCWTNMWVQFGVGAILVLGAAAVNQWGQSCELRAKSKQHDKLAKYHAGRRIVKSRCWSRTKWGAVSVEKTFRWRETSSVTLSHIRTEENFIKNNVDPTLEAPPNPGPEVVVLPLDRLKLFGALLSTYHVWAVAISSLGWAVISGGLATLIWLRYAYAEHVNNTGIALDLDAYSASAGSLYSDFVFFPTFLLIGYLGYIVAKYRDWLVNCHATQGKIHNLAITLGGAVTNPEDPQTRKALFRIYRYLTLSHFLLYRGVHQEFSEMALESDVVLRGLITTSESKTLMPARNRQRDTVLVWLIAAIHQMWRDGQIDAEPINFNDHVNELRTRYARFHDLFQRNSPNAWTATMLVVTDILILIVLCGFPFRMTVWTPGKGTTCFQIWVIVAVFLVMTAYRISVTMVALLRDPIHFHVGKIAFDVFDVDVFIASSERAIFFFLRATFDQNARLAGAHEDAIGQYLRAMSMREARAKKKAEAAKESHLFGFGYATFAHRIVKRRASLNVNNDNVVHTSPRRFGSIDVLTLNQPASVQPAPWTPAEIQVTPAALADQKHRPFGHSDALNIQSSGEECRRF